MGDLGFNGTSRLKTPNIDSFYKMSVGFTDFDVSPLRRPIRGAIMTG